MRTPTVALLRLAHNALSNEISRAVRSVAPEQRASHGNVMEQLDYRDGRRLTELADGAGMTPQSIGELVDQLEAMGHVERRPDLTDRRAKLVYRTARGKEASKAAARSVAKVETDLADLLGADTLDQVRSALTQIISAQSDSPQTD